jgi:hypothetical protein
MWTTSASLSARRYLLRCEFLRVGWTAVAVIAVVVLAGCGGPAYQVADVDGVLIINGQPGSMVHIEFLPDAGVKGPPSAADTDAQGAFTLRLMARDGNTQAGAVVGSHRVTLSDRLLSQSPDGRGVPIRFGPEYTLPGTTPLREKVTPGKQSLRIEIPNGMRTATGTQ